MGAPTSRTLQESCREAVGLHQKGALAEAERLYLHILNQPGVFTALHLMGALAFQQGRLEDALMLIGAALRIRPDAAEAQVNYGNVLKELGRGGEALASYDRALALMPDSAVAHYCRANLLRDMDRFAEALTHYDRAVALAPDDAEMWNNRGSLLEAMRRPQDAAASCRKALALRPDYARALSNLGLSLLSGGAVAEGLESFTRHARLVYGGRQAPAEMETPHKARHDREQRDVLAAEGIKSRFHLDAGARTEAPALTPQDADYMARQWRENNPQLVVLDDFLGSEALAALRRFCLTSTVWRKSYREGYLGALLEHGFSCPLLGQIAGELAEGLPAIFAGHPLRYLWAFKYDSSLSGVNIHADSAAVNVNFWITEDEANLDPESGGLIVWDKAAPLDWEFGKFNQDEAVARAFLKARGAKPRVIPYRANRAVIFNANLFHETDRFRFKDGYDNRRINITLLYGWRG